MARVYVKQRGDQSSLPHPPRMEVKLERLEGLPVEEFVENVARQLNLDKQQLHLMYGGRILKGGKTLDDYQIKNGSTLHIMHQNKKIKYASLPSGPEGMAVVFASSRIQSEIVRFIEDPDLVARMIPLGDPLAIREVLQDPDLLAKISDIARINHHLHKNYLLFPVMKALLRLHRINYSVQDSGRVDHDLSLQVGQILELAAGSELENMIIPSEASSNHPGPGLQMIHGTIHSATPTTSSSSSFANTTGTTGASTEAVAGRRGEGEEDDISLGLPSLGVTPADLASALASIGTENSNSQPTSMSMESSPQPLSLPSIFPSNLSGSSGPASLQESDTLSVPPVVNRSLSDSGRGSTGIRHSTSRSTASGPASTSISQLDLQQALTQALSNVQQQQQAVGSNVPVAPPPTSQSHHTPSSHHQRHSSHQSHREQALREKYTAHLQQLHAMGITYSDSECLHALEAAQGDLQTALEILMGDPNEH